MNKLPFCGYQIMLSTITMETDCNNFLGPVSDYAVNNMWAREAFYINAQEDYKMYVDPADFRQRPSE